MSFVLVATVITIATVIAAADLESDVRADARGAAAASVHGGAGKVPFYTTNTAGVPLDSTIHTSR